MRFAFATAAAVVLVAAGQPTTQPRTQPATQPATRPAEAETNPPGAGFDLEGSDPRAIEIADAVMEAMGGREAWDRTRYVTWSFFGRRRHLWDKQTGLARIEGLGPRTADPYVMLIDVSTGKGRAWKKGEDAPSDELRGMLDAAQRYWINDSYWLVMPYKLKDTGVTLRYLGEGPMADGRPAHILELTFTDVGHTPDNKYHVYVGLESQLVEQWDFFARASDETPRFQGPWLSWKRYGRIMLSGDRGVMQGRAARLTDIAVFDDLPESLFSSPDHLDWDALLPDTTNEDP